MNAPYLVVDGRFIISEDTYWGKDFAQKLVNLGYKAPTFSPPAIIVKFLANFDKNLRMVKPVIGVDFNIDSSSARSTLGFEPMSFEKTVEDTCDYIKSIEVD